MEFTIAK